MTRLRFTRAESSRIAEEMSRMKFALDELRRLARSAVEEYPVASGLYVDMDGKDGYGSLRALRLFLQGSAPDFKASQNSAERDPSVMPDWAGADTTLNSKAAQIDR